MVGKALKGRQSTAGAVVEPPRQPGIVDGIGYGMPVALGRLQMEALNDAGKLDDYLREASDTFHFQFDKPYRGAADDYPVRAITEDPLKEWNETTREYVLTQTHAAYSRNPLAQRAVKYIQAFTVGEGFNLVCKNTQVRDALEAFIDDPDNRLRDYERTVIRDLCVDGELLIRLYEDGERLIAVPLRPWECQWIVTQRGFFRRPVSYRFQRYVTEGDYPGGGQRTETEDIPAEQIMHVAINRHGYELRGRPELYAVLPWLKAYKEWLENRARQNHWRGSLLWFVQVAGGAGNLLSAVASRWRKGFSPGSVAVESDKVNVQPLNNTIAAGDAAEDGRQIKLMSAVGFGLPEYMLSDGSNSNLASATSQEMPALTTFQDFQYVLVECLWTPLFRRVVQRLLDMGLLPPQVAEQDADGDDVTDDDGKPRMMDTLDAFTVEYAPLQNTDIINIANAMQIALNNGLVSRETASRELGFDPAIEDKRIERERAKAMSDMMSGQAPMPPGMTPPGYEDADDDEDAYGGAADTGRRAQPGAAPNGNPVQAPAIPA